MRNQHRSDPAPNKLSARSRSRSCGYIQQRQQNGMIFYDFDLQVDEPAGKRVCTERGRFAAQSDPRLLDLFDVMGANRFRDR